MGTCKNPPCVPYKTPFVEHPFFHDRCRSSLVTFQPRSSSIASRLPRSSWSKRRKSGVFTAEFVLISDANARWNREDIYIYFLFLIYIYIRHISSCENAEATPPNTLTKLQDELIYDKVGKNIYESRQATKKRRKGSSHTVGKLDSGANCTELLKGSALPTWNQHRCWIS